jgi:threonylcarbamoyladenosine tRNA methylthiotransferase MtaB
MTETTAQQPSEQDPADEADTASARTPDTGGVRFVTLGCRLNTYETEIMREHAAAAGLDNAIVVNTCAVTGEAVRQAKQTLRRLRRENPDARIVATGCAAQIEPETFANLDAVDHVVGNGEKLKRETFDALALDVAAPPVLVDDIMEVRETAGHMISGFTGRARAYVQVQNGCDHRCTFCIIPYGRGPSRSVPAGHVVKEIQALVTAGYNEVVLTGVDMTSYGSDLPGQPKLGRLVLQILKHVPDLPRLRLSSIDQVEVDDDLMRAIADEPRLMPHLHLSLQAGDDMILKRMKRRHLRDDAIRFCEEARKLRPDIVFGADLIAGFPTETEEMFTNTLDVVEACGLTYLHVFPFSPRQGTPAARMPQLPKAVIKERAAALRAKGQAVLAAYERRLDGTTARVIVETPQTARTPHFAEVALEAPAEPGSLLDVRLTMRQAGGLNGQVLSSG